MTDDDKPVEAYRVVYDETIRALESQSRQVDELRSRSNLLLSVAVVATSFLAPASLRLAGNLTFAAWIAVAAFIATVLLLLAVLLPRQGWTFTVQPKQFLAGLENNPGVSTAGLYCKVAEDGDRWLGANSKLLSARYRLFGLAALMLLATTSAWVADILIRR